MLLIDVLKVRSIGDYHTVVWIRLTNSLQMGVVAERVLIKSKKMVLID